MDYHEMEVLMRMLLEVTVEWQFAVTSLGYDNPALLRTGGRDRGRWQYPTLYSC